MRIIDVKNCIDGCHTCNRDSNINQAIIFDKFVLPLCDKCIEDLKRCLNEGAE